MALTEIWRSASGLGAAASLFPGLQAQSQGIVLAQEGPRWEELDRTSTEAWRPA